MTTPTLLRSFSLTCLVLAAPYAAADTRPSYPDYASPHAGEMDTDGILSRGELPNPAIDYADVQRRAERRGDARFANPYNDAAADADRYSSWRDRQRWSWDDGRRDPREYRDSWWNW